MARERTPEEVAALKALNARIEAFTSQRRARHEHLVAEILQLQARAAVLVAEGEAIEAQLNDLANLTEAAMICGATPKVVAEVETIIGPPEVN